MISITNWLVELNDFGHIYESQPVLFFTQCLLLFGGLCTLKHGEWVLRFLKMLRLRLPTFLITPLRNFAQFLALASGSKWVLLWFIVVLNGTLLEVISTSVPNISLFWHSQGPVMLFGRKVPLGIILFCKCQSVKMPIVSKYRFVPT